MTTIAALERGLASNPVAQFNALTGCFEDVRNRFLMAHRTGAPALVKRLEKWLAKAGREQQALLAELSELLTPVRVPARPAADTARSLAAAVVAWAKATGAGLWSVEAVHGQVAQHALEADRQFWQDVPPERTSGLLREQHHPEVAELIAAHGVLVWWVERDGRHRIVDTERLTAHADIRAFVVAEPERGKRCRACQIPETPTCILVAVDPEKRRALTVDGSGVVQLQPEVAYMHQQCEPTWLRWLEIAQRYPTQQAAEEADLAAGRSRREVLPPAPAIEPAPAPVETRVNPDDFGGQQHQPEVHTSRLSAAELAARIRRARGEG